MIEDPLVGRQLANYRVERLIGRGGMASVYYAQDVKLDRPVAIKIIDARFRGNPAYTQRFLQEARAVASWRHEHIIQVFYAGDEDGLYYFAMEFIDGPNLSQILAKYTIAGDMMPHEDVLRYGQAIAEALDYAHGKGVIHRDVKPSNVLVSSEGRIVLGDFGLALYTEQGSMGEIFGTAHYTAPEQARRSNEAVPQSDLYSLGVMLFEMLTGVLPFDDPSPASVALQHITQSPPSPCELNPSLNPNTGNVLLKSLAKDSQDRYQNGAELIEALKTALYEPVSAQRPASGTQLPPPPAVMMQQAASSPEPADWSNRTTAGIHSSAESIPVREPIPTGPTIPETDEVTQETTPDTLRTAKASQLKSRPIWLWAGLGGCSLLAIIALIITTFVFFEVISASGDKTASPTITSLAINLTVASPILLNSPSSKATIISTIAPKTPTLPLQPSSTSQPSSTPTQVSPTMTPTPKYLDGRHFKLFYNETSFYMFQEDGKNGPIAPVSFERLDSSGQVLNRFDGIGWAEYFDTTMQGWCMRLEILNATDFLRPADCGVNYSSTRWPVASSDVIFWNAKPRSTEFRVLWKSEEIVRCQISTGTCEVYLP